MLRTAAILVTLSVLLGSVLTDAQTAERVTKLPRPIIADLFAQPKAFAGRRIVIYGLVIESNLTGTEFLLQDVSQRPLKIIGSKRLKAAAGDQLTVVGTFHGPADSPYLVAKRLIPTVVIGGGGCC
jgi:hypothetical protein